MNTTHIHLLLNHFPIIGTLIGSGVLLWGIIKKDNSIKSIAAMVLALMAVIAIPVYITGEPAQESIEKMPGISESITDLHEEAATLAIWLMGIAGVASLAALFINWQKKKLANNAFIILFAISVISFAAMARTGYYGGQIHHAEIAGGNTINQQNETGGGEQDKKEKDND